MSDNRVPMSYRGISLLTCISKIYTSFLNRRITGYLENNDILADEQNGFRTDRSCEDHVFSLNSVIKNNNQVYTAYIDLKRCFDYIDRDMLLYKLLLNGIDGNVYNSIKNIYSSSVSAVRINNKLTEWFSCYTGVKQGCNLSPTLFAIFANDLVREINDLDLGFQIGDRKLSMLLYADDIVLMAKSEEDLQCMLNKLHDWCKRWRVLINGGKSKCMHFRKGRTQRTEFVFKIGNDTLETVDRYKYLGVIFHEKCDYTPNSESLGKAAGRALGAIISKIHSLKDFGFKSYDKLFHSCVTPVMDYCSSIWGSKSYQHIDNVQHRAMRYFLGVHRFTPILAMVGDTGWLPSIYRRWKSMIRLWNRLIVMEDSRLTKIIFIADYRHHNINKNWTSELKHALSQLGLRDHFEAMSVINLTKATDNLNTFYTRKWHQEIQSVPKLRTYRLFKDSFSTERYITLNLLKSERSVMCQFRSGILPLRIETGRFVGESVEQRLCRYCDSAAVEDEKHFLFDCSLYEELRNAQYSDIFNYDENPNLNEILVDLMTNRPRRLAKFLLSAYLTRRKSMFR